MIFLMTSGHLKRIVDKAKKMGFDDGRVDGYGAGHTRGYKQGFETGRLYERSPELFGMNYFTYLREIGQLTEAHIDNAPDLFYRFMKPQTDIPPVFKEAFDE